MSNGTNTTEDFTLRTPEALKFWNNPYLLGCMSLSVIAVVSLLLSLLLVFTRLHHFHHCSLFLVEMAVGSLTSEAIMHLLPSVIFTEKPRTASGMPTYFPRLAAVTAGVCVLHALDTASVVFFGRRQSTTHAMELRNSHQRSRTPVQTLRDFLQGSDTAANGIELVEPDEDAEDTDDIEDAGSIKFEDEGSQYERTGRRAGASLSRFLANPRQCLQPGPYRLCSLLSAGSLLHSFSNGVAIGAAFVKSWKSGVHLSLSVGMHELAHKVADFAVLTASGFTMPSLLMLNFCYWLSAFLGLFISVPLSQQSEILRAWIMTVATAVFVYLALVTMSSMVRRNYLPRHKTAFIVGNAAMTTGVILTILVSILEFSYYK